jgi:hypothetical protein
MVSTADASAGSEDASHSQEENAPTGFDTGRTRRSKKKQSVVQQAKELCQTSTALPWLMDNDDDAKPQLGDVAQPDEQPSGSDDGKSATATNSHSADEDAEITPNNSRPGSADVTCGVPHIIITPNDGELPERRSPLMALADAAR